MAMMGHMVVGDGHLSTPDTCADVAHAVVIADRLVLVVGISLAGLHRIPFHLLPCFFVRTDQCSATRGRNHLVAVERHDAVVTEGAHDPALVSRSEGFGSILQHRDVVFVGDGHNLVDLRGHAVEIHSDNGLGLLAGLLDSVFNSRLQQFRVHIPGILLRVNHDGRSTYVTDRVRRGTERKALHQHLVAHAYAQCHQSQVHSRRTTRQRHNFLRTQPFDGC